MSKTSTPKKKTEVDEVNEIFDKFQKHIENLDDKIIDYEEIFRKKEMLKHFNRRILECNRICLKHPEIDQLLYEEQKCLTSCQRKIFEVESVVAKYIDEIKAGKFDSPYLNPDANL